jgi:hypothetical protein
VKAIRKITLTFEHEYPFPNDSPDLNDLVKAIEALFAASAFKLTDSRLAPAKRGEI